jgi:hypothetical protein
MDSEQDISADEAQDTAYAGAGARLNTAREARRLDLAQIAAETRIPLRHLEAIEAGDFAALPSRAYAIGFSRTFAKAVGLDEAAITDAVRAELADDTVRRSAAGSGMEPGDPAKLPSAALAWFGAFAALVLAVGLIAFFGSRFGAGSGPAPLTAPPAPAPAATASPAVAPVAGGEVVLTALEDGVWVRIYEEGGERLLERQLAKGERFAVPADALDPRINTGRPDALGITVGGQNVPKLAETPTTLSGVAISAGALLGREAAVTEPATVAVAATPTPTPAPRPAPRISASPSPAATQVAPTPADPTETEPLREPAG